MVECFPNELNKSLKSNSSAFIRNSSLYKNDEIYYYSTKYNLGIALNNYIIYYVIFVNVVDRKCYADYTCVKRKYFSLYSIGLNLSFNEFTY